jgi:hypothetical protein
MISLKLRKKLRRVRYEMEGWAVIGVVSVGSFSLGWLLGRLIQS